MGQTSRIFASVLLVSVFLNLADWPYVDEIRGARGTVDKFVGAADRLFHTAESPSIDESMGRLLTSEEGVACQSTSDKLADSAPASKANIGLLLLAMQGLLNASSKLPVLSSARAIPSRFSLLQFLHTPRLDRPPAVKPFRL